MKFKSLIAVVCIFSFSFPAFAASANISDKNVSSAIRATPPAPKFTDAERQTELANRRAKVLAAMDDKSVLILFSALPKIYTGDVDFMYRQENNLYYLTNLKQNNAALVLVKDGAQTSEILFLPKRNPALETWNGKMYSSEDATRISGIKTLADFSEFNGFLESVKEKKSFNSKDEAITYSSAAENIYLLLPKNSNDSHGKREFVKENEFAANISGYKIKNAQPIFAALRLVKSPFELKLLQHAIDITTEAQMRAMATAKQVKWEYETQAEIEYIFRKRNADYWGYPSIVGCGPNATTLHYVESQGEIKPGDLLLMDVGAEYDHYTADVTRTFPVNGKFTKAQAEIYQIVYDAQEAAAKTIKPGARFSQSKNAAAAVIEQGLAKLGLISGVGAFIPGTEQEAPDGKGGIRTVGIPQYTLWFMHGWGHWLGMNVHDVGDYGEPYREGMVTTNEPGIYIREDALRYLPKTAEAQAFAAKIRPAFEKYKNIGVRIEDDMLVTKTGVEWMTKNLPRTISGIEAFMAKNSIAGAENFDTKSVPRFAVFDVAKNFVFDNSEWNALYENKMPNGASVRRGWIWSGKETAYSGFAHAESHGE
ncbi:MAG TPA: aminopeptidase P family protein [Pyrinomonadaceae bacterium]|nr:aminopeptidase P family protein [Pyrinomonadaceae bacterium]